MTKKRVTYFKVEDIGNYHYGQGHPMKPHRNRMTDSLVAAYGIHRHCEIIKPGLVSSMELSRFHSEDYINFLRVVTPDNCGDFDRQMRRFNVGDDCPIFDGLYEFCHLYSSASIQGAARLNQGKSDIVCNWTGGFHHAKKCEASGFCYVNDIVLAILELLKVHQRVLYIDIDIHHGDGVEEAFYCTDRVMTCSFHKFGEFFPGTGHVNDVGHDIGKNYSINFPLNEGMDDESYQKVYRPIIDKIMEVYRPGAVVMCCGADSLSGDRLGCWNLSIQGHADSIEYVKQFNLPMLVLGGGGYSLRNVSRCWAYETSMLTGHPVPDQLPMHDYIDYMGPDYRIHTPVSNMKNLNSREYLEETTMQLLTTLHDSNPSTSIQIQTGQVQTQLNPKPEEESYVSFEPREHPSELVG